MKESFELADAVAVIAEAVEDGGEFTLYPMGVSMLPTIVPGRDSVRLVRADTFKKGDIILYKRACGSFVLHRILKLCKDGTLILCGDNQRALEKDVSRKSVLFLVDSYEKNGKSIKRNGVLFWLDWRFARALQLAKAIYRRVFSVPCRKSD